MRLAWVAWAVALLAAGSVFAASGDPLVVTGDGVNVRTGPGMENRIMMRLYRDREVVEIAREGEWVRVEIAGSGGQEGWIHSSLLARPEDAGTARAAARAPARRAEAPVAAQPTAEPERGTERAAAADTPLEEGKPREVPDLEAEPRGEGGPADLAEVRPEAGTDMVEPAAGPLENEAEVNRFKESVSYLNSRAVQVAGVSLFTDVKAVDPRTVAVGITEAWTTVPPAGQRSYLNTLVDRWSAANGGETPVNVRIIDPEGQVLVEQSGP